MITADRKHTTGIAVHCSATPPQMNYKVDEHWIRALHKKQGWSDAGYNMVICWPSPGALHAQIQIARPLDHAGAHVQGSNHSHVGICLVGGVDVNMKPADNFHPLQKVALVEAIKFLTTYVYPTITEVRGHRQFKGVAKACPSFDVPEFLRESGLERFVAK